MQFTVAPRSRFERLSALVSLQGLYSGYVPWSSSAMEPTAIQMLCNEVLVNGRRSIVEFGPGVSTLFLAAAIKLEGGDGRLFAVETDGGWARFMAGLLTRAGLDDVVQIVLTRTSLSQYAPEGPAWFDENELTDALKDRRFDLVVVDGPPAFSRDKAQSRYPALPYLQERSAISDDALIVLDDAFRYGEKKILRRWSAESGYRFRRLRSLGVAVAKLGDGYTTV